MKITIEPKLINAKDHLFSISPVQFQDQKKLTKSFIVPIQQREYTWGEKIDHIEALVEDVMLHANSQDVNQTSEKYFIGTILLENQNEDYLKVIDGQQRITTMYLISFLKYLISKFRLLNMPLFPEKVYGLELQKRWAFYLEDEKRIFNHNLSDDMTSYVQEAEDEPLDSSESYNVRLGIINKSSTTHYWNNVASRLDFKESTIKEKFLTTLEKAELEHNDENVFNIRISDKSIRKSNNYLKALNHLLEEIQNYIDVDNRDKLLDTIREKLDEILDYSGLCAIISENEDDSFRLFEILNARGEDLSALDLIKNLILEKTHPNFPDNFVEKWNKIKKNVKGSFTRGKQDTYFVEHILKSEGRASASKSLSYLNNRLVGSNGGDDFRMSYFVDAGYYHLFEKLGSSSNILYSIYNCKTAFESTNAFTAFQNIQFMRLINYKWGPKILLSANLLFQDGNKLNSSIPMSFNEGDTPAWLQKNTSLKKDPLTHFIRVFSDLVLKLGLYGIITKKQSDQLPKTSKKIVRELVSFISSNKNFISQKKIDSLLKRMYEIVGEFTKEKDDLISNLNYFEGSSQVKKSIIGVIIYYIYGLNGRINDYENPEKEHIESTEIGANSKDYYTESDRDRLINKLGNFMLLEKVDNGSLGNLPIFAKIDKMAKDPRFKKSLIYEHPLFEKLKANSNTSSIHYDSVSQMLQIEDDEKTHYDKNGAPTKLFFETRTKEYSLIAADLICNTSNFMNNLPY